MSDVTELQRQRIALLEEQVATLTSEIIQGYETIANQSQVLAYLTDKRFLYFSSKDNWSKVITDFCEYGSDLEPV